LDHVAEHHQVQERTAALERVSLGTNTFWADAHRCSTIVLLQDRVRHVGEAIDGCRKSLTTMFFSYAAHKSSFGKFWLATRSFQDESAYSPAIELNLIVGANFALGWVWKWHSKLNFNTISRGLPPPQRPRSTVLQVHMDATLEPARRMIAKLLEADAGFFHEYHYLNPLMVDSSDQVAL
jgi:hypothetical protein